MDEQFIKKSQYDFHKYVMDYLQGTIRFADTKASLILAILGFMLPSFIGKWQQTFHLAKEAGACWIYFTLIGLTTLFYGIAFGLAIAVFKPRLPSKLNKGFIFFQDILGHGNASEYVEEAKKQSPDGLLDSVLYQNWVLSKILNAKFHYLSYAITCGVIGVALGILCILCIPGK
jgi:hypothetical protein